ncbi:MAG: hypothetical protein ACRDBM_07970, partial [Sporomusa sp.]
MSGYEVLLRTGDNSLFFNGVPVAMAAYFVIISSIFSNRTGLKRWVFWLWMNIPGYILCWIVLFIRTPEMLFNPMGALMMEFFLL